MSCIHYKFKSSLDYNSVTFDGLHLSLGDLKKAISVQKRLKSGEFELEVINAQTGEVYKKSDELIAKNTSVIVSRVPNIKTNAASTQRSWEAFKQECANKAKEENRLKMLEKQKQQDQEAAPIVPASEIDKIKAVIDQSTKGFEPSSLPGRHPFQVSSEYVCKRCGRKGHYITHCPNIQQEDRVIEPRVKRTTGIPSTMLTIVDDPLHPGALLTHSGQFAVPTVDVQGYREGKKDPPPFQASDKPAPTPEKKIIPKELLCHICEDLCVDAAIAPCCGTSFCDECLREELLESEDHQCPSCHEINVSPDRIVANRSMRIAVTNFLNDSGYTKVKRRRSNSTSGDANSAPVSVQPTAKPPSPPQVSSPANFPVSGIESISTVGSGTNQERKNFNPGYQTNYSHRPPRHNEPYHSRQGKPWHTSNSDSYYPRQPPPISQPNAVGANQIHPIHATILNQVMSTIPPPIGSAPYAGVPPYQQHNHPSVYPPPQMGPHSLGMPILPVKKPDVFDSFADFTKKKSRTPEMKSRSRSRSNSRHRRHSTSYSPARKGSHSFSPRRGSSRSRSRTRSPYRRSRSTGRSPDRPSPRKRSRSKSPFKRRSMSRESRGLSTLRSLSPRSKSPSPFKSVVRKVSRSPRSLRTRSRSTSRPYKRPIRSRSRSWSKPKKSRSSRSYSPLSPRLSKRRSSDRSPRRSPIHSPRRSPLSSPYRSSKYSPKRISPHSPVRSRRSLTPRRRSRSFTPKKRSPIRSRSRSPYNKRRTVNSRSPHRKRSLSPYNKNRRSQSPYKSLRRRTPSPLKPSGRDRDYYSSRNDTFCPNNTSQPPVQADDLPPPPYLPNMALPPPQEYFKHNPEGYQEFLRTFYAQVGNHAPWPGAPGLPPPNPQPPLQGNQPYPAPTSQPPPVGSFLHPHNGPHHQPSAAPYFDERQGPWNSTDQSRRPRSISPSGRPLSHYQKFGDRYRRDDGRSGFNRGRGRDRNVNEYKRFDTRDRRAGEHNDYNRDRRGGDVRGEEYYRDERKGRSDLRDKHYEDKGKRINSKDRKIDSEIREKRGKENDKHRDREKIKGAEKAKDSGKSKDTKSLEKKREKSSERDTKSKDKPKENEEIAKERKQSVEKKAVNSSVDKENEVKEVVEKEVLSERPKESDNVDSKNMENDATNTDTNSQSQDSSVAGKDKKAPTKKKVSAGGKKLKAKAGNVADGEKKVKKIKKKKLTFGASETENKGLKKKKLKRVMDYKAENTNITSEDADCEKSGLSDASPLKKPKLDGDENAMVNEGQLSQSAAISNSQDGENNSAGLTPDMSLKQVAMETEQESSPEKKTDVMHQLPELSKWERDDFDLPEMENKQKPEDKIKEKTMLPRSVVDKAEKFLVEKPMKNSVIAAHVASNDSGLEHSERKTTEKQKPLTSDKTVKNTSEKPIKEMSSRLKDKEARTDDKYKGFDKTRPSHNDNRDREEMERHREITDRRNKDDHDYRHRSPVRSGREGRDYRFGNVKDYRSKSPVFSKDHRSSPHRSSRRDYRSKSPSRNNDYRAKSPRYSGRDHRSKSPLHTKDYHAKSPRHNNGVHRNSGDHKSKSPVRHKDRRSKSPTYGKDRRSKSPSHRSRKVHVDGKRDYVKKGLDIKITVEGDRSKKSRQNKNSSVEEDERSVVKSHSLEKELKTSSKSQREKEPNNKKLSSEKKESFEKETSKSQKNKEKRDIAAKKDNGSKDIEPKAGDVVPHRSPRDLRHKIEKSQKSQANKQRKMSAMDESEFVPDYEDLGPETNSGDREEKATSSPDIVSSPEHDKDKKSGDESPDGQRKSEDRSGDEEGEVKADGEEGRSSKHKKSKKKHKKKEKKEKHKHKKKKHKNKSKEKDVDKKTKQDDSDSDD